MDKDFTDAMFPDVPNDDEAQNTAETPTEVVEETTPEVAATAEAPVAETVKEQPREDNGRFTSQERPAIPVEALIEERNKRQEAERQRQEYERQLAELRSEQAKAKRPDSFDDPDGYDSYVQSQIDAKVNAAVAAYQQQQQQQWFNSSALKAEQAHGKDTVQAAVKFAAERATLDPAFQQQMMTQSDPVSWILEQQNRHAQQQAMLADPDAWALRRAAELSNTEATNVAPANATQTATKIQAPKSVNSMGSGSAPNKGSTETDADFLKGFFGSRS